MDAAAHASSKGRSPSLLAGPTFPPLRRITLGALLDQQAHAYGPRESIICHSLKTRWTYGTLRRESRDLARGLLSIGVKVGDKIGILAGNCAEYVAVLFAVAYVGGALVVLNNTYTASEALRLLAHSGEVLGAGVSALVGNAADNLLKECRILFTERNIGRLNMDRLLGFLGPRPKDNGKSDTLGQVVILRGESTGFMTYGDIKMHGKCISPATLDRQHAKIRPDDVCNLQYTSGSTGHPKAAMLTHFNLVNNARSIGERLDFTPADILCCPPPLFHCFGLVLGVLATLSHGAKIVLPSQTFLVSAVLESLDAEQCTALHGVPTMFEELLNLDRPRGWRCDGLRTGIIAGAPVPKSLMTRLVNELGMKEFTSSYGLTEASPTCFNAFTHDTIETRLTTVGKLLPHLQAKIVDRAGDIVPQGSRGELCIAGYSLQKGYFKNLERTHEAMKRDDEGTLWLYTGDEASFDKNGYCTITGRYKDIIIRGGENIYPVEIEDRLCEHVCISRAAVVGIRNARYGEVVGAFLQHSALSDQQIAKPTDEDIRTWTRLTLGRHKAPVHIFWLGDERVPRDIPQTGSGKVKKFELREIAESILKLRNQEIEKSVRL